MKSSIKNLQNINGLYNIRSYTGVIKKSGKPALPTTAILELSMRRNERDRLTAELERMKKRRTQMRKRLEEVEKEMNKLLEAATQTAVLMRGTAVNPQNHNSTRDSISRPAKTAKGKLILGY